MAHKPDALIAFANSVVDQHVDAVLRASGSALKYHCLPKDIDKMREAMRCAMQYAIDNQKAKIAMVEL